MFMFDDYKITVLDISWKGLKELPHDIDKYTNLKELNCSGNEITSLDNLPPNLEVLKCSSNKFTSLNNLPPNLEILNCSDNKITSLDNLPSKLEVLYCYNNKITSLDNLPSTLKELYCRCNPLKYDFKYTLENIRNYNASRMLSSNT